MPIVGIEPTFKCVSNRAARCTVSYGCTAVLYGCRSRTVSAPKGISYGRNYTGRSRIQPDKYGQFQPSTGVRVTVSCDQNSNALDRCDHTPMVTLILSPNEGSLAVAAPSTSLLFILQARTAHFSNGARAASLVWAPRMCLQSFTHSSATPLEPSSCRGTSTQTRVLH
jgi:hypothetical protein